MAPFDLNATRVARFETGFFDEGGTEVVAHEGGRIYSTNAAENRIDVWTRSGGLVASISLDGVPNGGGVTSVAVSGGVVAAAVSNADDQANGFVALFRADDLSAAPVIREVGVLPDMLTFTPDGAKIVVAIEGEPADDGSNDPKGGVSVVTLDRDDLGASTARTFDFRAFDGQEDDLRAAGVRIRERAPASEDFEPEHIAVDPQTGNLFITLQENNGVAVFDMTSMSFTEIRPLGVVDHSVQGRGIDASNEDGGINIETWPVSGLRMPDAIAAFVVDGRTYYATANEGDGREYDFYEDEADGEDLPLDPARFPEADGLQEEENLGALTVSAVDGDTDGDGDFDQLFSFGSRSFSIFDADGNLVFDSGDEFEQIIAQDFPERFNVNNDEPFEMDSRSDNKGPEPEAIATAQVDGRTLVFIGLERTNGIMVYDATVPAVAQFLSYIDPVVEFEGDETEEKLLMSDLGPETITVIPADESGSGLTEIAVANEISGSISIYSIELKEKPAFTLELFHIADQEAAVSAIENAPNLSAALAALQAQDLGGDGVEDNSLFLSSGDAYIPGLFFSASETAFGSRGIADILIQNELGLQAIAFGNHEFDFGTDVVEGLISGSADFALSAETQAIFDAAGITLDEFTGTAFPYLSGNLNFGPDANLAGLAVPDGEAPLPNSISGSTFFEVGGERIGVVAATTPTLQSISSPGDVGVQPSPFAANPTPEQLDALALEIQADVDALLAKHPEMNKVVLLAHMQQLDIEIELAGRLRNVDVIVAGGSNARLFDGNDRPRDGDSVQGDYPVGNTQPGLPNFLNDADGKPIAVVNTDGSYKYLGRLVIDFDANGEIIRDSYDPEVSGAYATDDQGVTELGAEGLIDPEIQAIVDAIEQVIEKQESNVFGVSEVFLNGNRSGVADSPIDPDGVRTQETNLGNLTADANLAIANEIAQAAGETEPVVLSIKNGGGIRASIGQTIVPPGGAEAVRLPNEGIPGVKPDGGISQNDIANALAFNNGLTLLTLTGEEIVGLLEHGVSALPSVSGRFPQIGGAKFSFDPAVAAGDRIQNAGLFEKDGTLIAALVRDGELVNPEALYRVVTLNFLATPNFNDDGEYIGGGDGYPFPNLNTLPTREIENDDGTTTIIDVETGDPAVIARVNRVDLAEDDASASEGAATFAEDGSEQDALAEYLFDNFLTDPFDQADVGRAEDQRIQNLSFRADAVFVDLAEQDAVFLSEIVEGSSNNKAVEIYNDSGAAIDFAAGGYALQYYFNGNASPGLTIGLTGTVEDGQTYVVAQSQAAAEIIAVADQTNGAGWFNGDDVIVLTRDGEIIDSFGQIGVDPGGEWPGGGQDDTLRRKDGIVSGDPDAEDPFDASEEWDVLPQDTFDDLGLFRRDTNRDVEEPEPTLISAIQSSGASTPLAGQRVTVQAVVTLVSDQLNGFFLQEEAGDSDGDDATSEGVFVFTGSDPTVSIGDVIEFDANVGEFFGLTQLSGLGEIAVIAEGADLPDAVEISLPLPDATDPSAFYESLEGMRVRFVADEGERLTVTDTFTSFGEVGVTSGDLLKQPTQISDSQSDEAFDVRASNARDFILFENAVDDTLSGAPRAGDGIVGDAIEGVLNFTFSEYKVETDGPVEFDPSDNPRPRQDAPDDVGGRLKVASFNVLNYFTTLDDGANTTATGLEPRGAETAEELEIQTSKIVAALLAIDADVLGLIEIENDEGTATQALVDALNAETAPGAYAFIDTGVVGTDAIKQAIIYKTASVAPTGGFAVLDGDAFVAPLTPGDPQNRPAVAQSFTEIATGEAFTVSVNHFKSKGSSTGAPGDFDPLEDDGALTRIEAAQELAAWLATDPTGSGDADQLTVGDFNAYEMERAIRALEDAGYVDLADAFGGGDFSYQFDGRFGTLDYAFANEELLSQITGATIWNVNSLEAYSIQYDGRDFDAFGDAGSPFASSDHDPVIVGLNLESEDEPILIVADPGNTDRLEGSDAAELFKLGSGPVNFIETGGGADVIEFLPSLADGDRTRFIVNDFDPDFDMVDFTAEEVAFARKAGPNLLVTFDNPELDSAIFKGVDSLDLILGDDPLAIV